MNDRWLLGVNWSSAFSLLLLLPINLWATITLPNLHYWTFRDTANPWITSGQVPTTTMGLHTSSPPTIETTPSLHSRGDMVWLIQARLWSRLNGRWEGTCRGRARGSGGVIPQCLSGGLPGRRHSSVWQGRGGGVDLSSIAGRYFAVVWAGAVRGEGRGWTDEGACRDWARCGRWAWFSMGGGARGRAGVVHPWVLQDLFDGWPVLRSDWQHPPDEGLCTCIHTQS